MVNVLNKKDVKARQGYIMDQRQVMFSKFKALNHTKIKQMGQDKECHPPFLPIGSCKGQFGGMLRQKRRPFRSPSNPRDISSQNQAWRILKVWFESSFYQAKEGHPHYTRHCKGQHPHSSNIVQRKWNF